MKNPCNVCHDFEKECRYCEAKHEWIIELLTREFNAIVGANKRRLSVICAKRKQDRSFTIQTGPAVLNYGNLINGSATR